MPQYSDDLWLGTATGPQSQGWNGPGQVFLGVGPLGRVYIYDVVPAALSATSVVNVQAVAAAGYASINGSAASGGVATLDCARGTTVVSTGAGDTTQTVTITGTDYWGQAQTQRLTLNGTTAVNSTKTFKTITAVYVSAALAGNLTVGTTAVIGLPYRVNDAGYLLRTGWNNTVADNAGTFVAADATTASATTGDVRGTYTPSGSAPDGTIRLVIAIGLTGSQAGPNATQTAAIGVTPA